MHSFDETHHLSLKQGESVYEKKNHIGIALCCTGCQCNTDGVGQSENRPLIAPVP